MANALYDKNYIKPLFYEQAAYEYLALRQFRKFALYMQKAANLYGIHSDMREYQINCLTILHPFYQTHKGWNQINS